MAKTTIKHLDSKVSDLQLYFEGELSKFRSELSTVKTPDLPLSSDERLDALVVRFDMFEAAIRSQMQSLLGQIENVKKQCDRLSVALDNSLQETCISKLLLFGIQERKDENLFAEVSSVIATKLKIALEETDIISCYRFGSKKSDDKFHRPVLVHFTRVRKRNEIFSNKRLLKGTKIVIAELLSPLRYEVYKAVKSKVGKHCWTNGGRIGFSWNGRTHHITTMKHFTDVCK